MLRVDDDADRLVKSADPLALVIRRRLLLPPARSAMLKARLIFLKRLRRASTYRDKAGPISAAAAPGKQPDRADKLNSAVHHGGVTRWALVSRLERAKQTKRACRLASRSSDDFLGVKSVQLH